MNRWFTLVAVMLVLALAGCSGTPAPQAEAPAPAPSSQPAPAPAPAAAEPKAGGNLVVVLSGEPRTLDPALAADTSHYILQVGYSRLITLTPDGTGLRNDLAEDWSVSADGREYVFRLRPDARFHDGSPVNAAAVKFSLERLMALEGGDSAMVIRFTDSITTEGDHVVRIRLTEPYAAYPHLLAQTAAGAIVNPALVKANAAGDDPHGGAWLADNVAGSGPFQLKEWVKGQHITLERAPDYYGQAAGVDTVTFRIIPDPATAGLMLQRGEVDILTAVSTDTIDGLRGLPGIDMLHQRSLGRVYFPFNHEAAPFDNLLVRRAINYAIDVEGILRAVVGEHGQPLAGLLTAGSFVPVTPEIPFKRDLTRAKQLMQEAGYPDGFSVDFYYPAWGNLGDISQVVQANVAEIGIELKLHQLGFGPFIETIMKGEAAWFPWVDNAKYNDPDALLYFKAHSNAIGLGPAGNIARYRNAAVDDLLDQAMVEQDSARRAELYKQVQTITTQDAYAVFFYQETYVHAVRDRVEGYVIPMIGRPDLSLVTLKS